MIIKVYTWLYEITSHIILKGEIHHFMPTHTAKLQWHPAFGAALRIEFGKELDTLDIRDEYPLSKKPLLMDILIVKKEQNIIQELIKHYEPNKSSLYHQTVMDLITRANWEQMEEVNKMCDALLELLADELKESKELGIKEGMKVGELTGIKKGELAGINLAKTIFKLSAAGSPLCDIAKQCNIPEQRVLEILE